MIGLANQLLKSLYSKSHELCFQSHLVMLKYYSAGSSLTQPSHPQDEQPGQQPKGARKEADLRNISGSLFLIPW